MSDLFADPLKCLALFAAVAAIVISLSLPKFSEALKDFDRAKDNDDDYWFLR